MGYPPGKFLIAQSNPAGRPFHARLPKGHGTQNPYSSGSILNQLPGE